MGSTPGVSRYPLRMPVKAWTEALGREMMHELLRDVAGTPGAMPLAAYLFLDKQIDIGSIQRLAVFRFPDGSVEAMEIRLSRTASHRLADELEAFGFGLATARGQNATWIREPQ